MSISEMPMSCAKALPGVIPAALMVVAIIAVAVVAPTENEMGDAQRILYIHVPVAWLGLLSFVIMAAAGILFLRYRDLYWDGWALAAAELGWLCCSLTLVTGSLWAHSAWGTWWTWDPRLTAAFVLWMIYSGCLLVRRSQPDAVRRARIGAVLAIVGLLDVPLVIMATRWFRGIHPVSPEMEPKMRLVLALCVVSMTVFFSVLLLLRSRQIRLENLLDDLIRQTPAQTLPAAAVGNGRSGSPS
jgi:heme exporter protein C